MELRSLLDRILDTVDGEAYLTPTVQVDPKQREAMERIARFLQAPDFDVEFARALAKRLHAEGRIDRVLLASSLHVIAASPKVRDYDEAARQAAAQEMAALELGGPSLSANLASVERHRGVLAFLMGRYEVALSYFTQTLEREHSAENLGNVLCTLVRLGEIDDARALLAQVRRSMPAALVSQLDDMVQRDPDLALLREEED